MLNKIITKIYVVFDTIFCSSDCICDRLAY